MERQSSAASSTEETSGAQQDLSGTSRRDDAHADFGVFKDFDFLEYEESIDGESTDNFNWGVRRRPLSEGDGSEPLAGNSSGGTGTGSIVGGGVGGNGGNGNTGYIANVNSTSTSTIVGVGICGSASGSGLFGGAGALIAAGVGFGGSGSGSRSGGHSILEESLSEQTPTMSKRRPRHTVDESSDEDLESESPLDEYHKPLYQKLPGYLGGGPPTSLGLRERRQRRDSVSRSDTSGSSAGDLGDLTPCNASPHLAGLMSSFRTVPLRDEAEEQWRRDMQQMLANQPMVGQSGELLWQLNRLVKVSADCNA